MASRIIWTSEAKSDLKRIAKYLAENFSIKVAKIHTDKYLETIDGIAEHPTKGRPSLTTPNHRQWPLDKHNFVVYSIQGDSIVIKNILAFKKKGSS